MRAQSSSSKWRARAGLIAIALAAYTNTFGLGLAQDAKVIISNDTRLQAATADNLKLILMKNYWWPLAGDGLYRPVTTLSLLFNYAVLGDGHNAKGYHVVSFLLHAINVWLLYELALLIFRRAGPAFFAAALWAVHPVGVESVTSIVGRADLLAAMAVLGGLLVYVRGRGVWTLPVLFLVSCAGVFAKENAAVLIGLMLLWDLSFGEKPRWRSYLAVAASLLVLLVVRQVVLGSLPPYNPQYVDNPLRLASFWTARWTAVRNIGLDLGLVLFPLKLTCDRSFDEMALATFSDSQAWLSLLAVIAILAAAITFRRKDRVAFWAAGFFGIALLPTSNLLFLAGAAVAERFLYLPSLAFTVMAAALLYRLKDERIARGVLIVLVALYTVRTFARNPAWNDDVSLATADLRTSPRAFRLHDMLAKALFEKDPRGNLGRVIPEEEAAYMILSSLPPSRSTAFPATSLGVYYAAMADVLGPRFWNEWYQKALTALLKAREISRAREKAYDDVQRAHGSLTVRDADPHLYVFLGKVCVNLERYQDALEALFYARGLDPRTLDLYDGLRMIYSAEGDLHGAVVAMEEKGMVDEFQTATMGKIRDLYQKMPDGQCAFVQRGAGWQFNVDGCPRVKADMCVAYSEMAQAFRDARLPGDGERAVDAARQHGCQVQ